MRRLRRGGALWRTLQMVGTSLPPFPTSRQQHPLRCLASAAGGNAVDCRVTLPAPSSAPGRQGRLAGEGAAVPLSEEDQRKPSQRKRPTRAEATRKRGPVPEAPGAGGAAVTETTSAASSAQHREAASREPKERRGPPAPTTTSSLFFHSGVASDMSRSTASLAALSVSPLRAASSPLEHYQARARELIVNPFNGKEMHLQSTVMKQLQSLGFQPDPVNALHLTWSPEAYLCFFNATLRRMQQRRCRASVRLASAGEGPRPRKGGRGRHHAGSAADVADVTTEEVLTAMLSPFERARSPLWHAHVRKLMRSSDVLTAVPAELQRLYANLTSAYMPPKLDATPDPAVKDLVLTQDQQNVAELALRGYSLYIGGSAGTGKTVLIKAIYHSLTSQLRLRVAMTATTGVAAVQLGGCTFHRAFNVPIEESIVGSARSRWDHNALRAVDVLIVDEVSLLSAQVLDALDMEARLARMDYAPFGGMQVIFCGDFLQLVSQAALDALPAYHSEAFRHLLKVQLVTPMRHVEGDPLVALLRNLRCGRCDAALMAALDRPIPEDAREVTYIFPCRRDAQQLNDEKLSELQTEEMICAPQRGPLELVGTFTSTALVVFPAAEALLPLPSREAIATAVQEEVTAVLNGKAAAGTQRFRELAGHDIVVMPTRTSVPGVTLKLRVYVDPREAAARREAARQAGLLRRRDSAATPARAARAAAYPLPFMGDRAGEEASSPSSDPPGETPLSTASTPAAPPPLSHPAVYMLNHPEAWTEAVSRVARRLNGTVMGVFAKEPLELVPLSVTATLADSSDSDVAEGLQLLRLKLGARVMVNRNLSRTVSNGSVGVVEAFAPPDYRLFPRQVDVSSAVHRRRAQSQRLFPRLPIVRLLSGEVVQVPPVSMMLGGTPLTYYYGHEVFTLPLQLGYGFTAHKVQGLTLRGLVVLDCKHFFECPHLIYVACSRVRSLDQLIVRGMKPEMVIVKKSAMGFSNSLKAAKDMSVLSVPSDTPRASWTSRFQHRVYPA